MGDPEPGETVTANLPPGRVVQLTQRISEAIAGVFHRDQALLVNRGGGEYRLYVREYAERDWHYVRTIRIPLLSNASTQQDPL